MALDPDVLSKAIEDKLDALSQAAGKGPLPDVGKEDREMLFAAIAQAVVAHFQAQAEAHVDITHDAWTEHGTGTIK